MPSASQSPGKGVVAPAFCGITSDTPVEFEFLRYQKSGQSTHPGEPRRANAWARIAVAIPVTCNRAIGYLAVKERRLRRTGCEVIALKPNIAVYDARSVGAVAIPVTNDRTVTGKSKGQDRVGVSRGVRVS